MKTTKHETNVGQYYADIWSMFAQWWCSEETLGLHYALYDHDAKTFKEATLNMNKYVGELLGLQQTKNMKILDAGCGVGGTSMYLAQRFPNASFKGITISPLQIELANHFVKEKQITNAEFTLKSFVDTGFADNSFDGIFALESITYAKNANNVIDELHRVLKPGGKLVIIDGLLNDVTLNSVMQKIYDDFCIARGFSDPPHLDDLEEYIRKKGFSNINHKDLSKQVAKSQIRSFVIGLPYFIYINAKRLLSLGNYDPKREFPRYSIGASVNATLIGSTGIISYYSLTATKK